MAPLPATALRLLLRHDPKVARIARAGDLDGLIIGRADFAVDDKAVADSDGGIGKPKVSGPVFRRRFQKSDFAAAVAASMNGPG